MKKTATLLLLALLSFPLASQNIPIITVLDFKTNNISAADMRSIISLLSSALFKTGRFKVIDVTQRDTLLKELEFSMSGCTDESCQLRIGKMLSAEQIVVGDIAKVGTRYMLSSKMLQTETAGTLASADGIYPTMDALVDDLYAIASTLAGGGGQKAAAAATLGAAAQPAQAAAAPLRIAVLAPLSGNAPEYGVSARDGALLAISEWNNRGGVLGSRIEPLIEDGKCEAGPAAEAAHRIIEKERIRFIIGEVCSQASIPVSKIANDSGVLMISPSSTNAEVTMNPDGRVKSFVFRACFTNLFQADAAAAFAFDRLAARTAFSMRNLQNEYSLQLSDEFERSFRRRGGEIVATRGYLGANRDFSTLLDSLKWSNSDIVYLPELDMQVASKIIRQARGKGIKKPFLGGDAWSSDDVDLSAADGSYYTDHFFPDDPRPAVARFREAYLKGGGASGGMPYIPGSIAALSYDAANMLLQAIQQAASDDPAVVRVALEKLRFDGVTGQISFDQNHNPIKPAVIVAIRGGKRELAGTYRP
jgi:branched-chain amino acid transport system substrate-binding protein